MPRRDPTTFSHFLRQELGRLAERNNRGIVLVRARPCGILRPMTEPWQRSLLLVVPLLVVLGLLAWLPRRVVTARGWVLFRCLLPSWQFFEQIESVPALQYRVAADGHDWSDWQNALPAPARTAGSLWLNAPGNLHLACRSLVEHLLAELDDTAANRRDDATAGDARDVAAARVARQAAELVSYRLLCALVELRARAALPASTELRYQFRLIEAERAGSMSFLSGVHGSA